MSPPNSNDRRASRTARRGAAIGRSGRGSADPSTKAFSILVTIALLAVVGTLAAAHPANVGSASHGAPSLVRPSTAAPTGAHASPARNAVSLGSSGWENLTPSVSPGPRWGEAAAYDGADRYLVLFGGWSTQGSGDLLNDTWTFQNGTWANVTASAGVAPPAREYANLVADPHDGYLVLVGGTCARGAFCNDTWEFNAGRWSALGPAPINPASSSTVAAYDSTDGYLVLADCANHSTHTFSAGVWANVSVPAPKGCAAAISDDPANHGVLFDGGEQGGTSNATWIFSAGNWTNVTSTSGYPAGGARALYQSIACYDPALGAVLQVGPNATGNGLGPASTSLYNSSWTNATTPLAPDWGVYPALAWDSAISGAVLVTLSPFPSLWVFTAHPAIADLAIHADRAQVDVGASEGFSAAFLGGTAPFAYAWSFGDGTTNASAAPTHSYGSVGNYTARLTLTDGSGSSMNATTPVDVVTGLLAAPSATPDPTEAGLATSFGAGLTGGFGPATVTWTFGDGNSSAASSPTHAYAAPGTYNVSLSASDGAGGSASGAFVLTVAPALAVTIAIAPAAPELGQLTNFTANATGGVGGYRFSWAFGDGGTGGNLSRISHVFTTDGPFSPSVSVVDGAGGSARAATTVNIALNLSVFANWSMGAAPLPIGFGSHVQGGHPGYSYQWVFGDGATSTAPAPSHTYRQPGFYQATLTVTDAAGTAAQAGWPLYVAVGGQPLGVAVVATPAQIAPGGSFVVTAQPAGGSGGYSVQWSTGTARCLPTGIASERCTVDTAGKYTIGAVVTDAAGGRAQGASLVVAGSSTGVGTPSGPLSSGLPPLAVGLLGAVAGATIAGLAVALAGRRGRRRGARGPSGGEDPRTPPPNSGPEDDPFGDLI